jgi:sec-independent protein translocase protein TatB
MFDVAPTELLLVGFVALVVIGPKDLPKAMRVVGQWVGRARRVANQFRSGIDTMIRESELAEMEKQWAAENERIMREHPSPALPAPDPQPWPDEDGQTPVMVEQPVIRPDAPVAEPEAPKPKPRKPRAPKAVAVEAAPAEAAPKPRARKPKAVAAEPEAPAPKPVRKPRAKPGA